MQGAFLCDCYVTECICTSSNHGERVCNADCSLRNEEHVAFLETLDMRSLINKSPLIIREVCNKPNERDS